MLNITKKIVQNVLTITKILSITKYKNYCSIKVHCFSPNQYAYAYFKFGTMRVGISHGMVPAGLQPDQFID